MDSDWSVKEFWKGNEKKLNLGQHFPLRNLFARILGEMSLRMPLTYFAQTFSHFAEFFLSGKWPLSLFFTM